MIPRDDADKVNEAVERMAQTIWGSYETAVENTAAMQESNTRLARSLYEGNIKVLEAQVEIQADLQRHTLRGLAEQMRKHREAFQELSQESLGAYDGFLDSLSSYYKEVSKGLEETKD